MDYELKVRKADREFNGVEYSTCGTDLLALCWPCREVYASDDRSRRRDTGGALAQRQTVRV